MSFEERSYSGRIFRPTPEVHIEEDASFGIIATPWGNRSAARKVIDTLKDYVLSARQDSEATSPFQKLTCLSPTANTLRAGLMLANDLIYREDNKSEYTAGVEVVVFAKSDQELAYAHVGHPNSFLARPGLPWIPLTCQIDLSSELSSSDNILSPLPLNLLGLHMTTNLNVASIRLQPEDRIIFLSHSHISQSLASMPQMKPSLPAISEKLARQYPELPFWLGIYALP